MSATHHSQRLPPTFEKVDHTADLAIRVYGRSMSELYSNAAAAMFSLMTDPAAIRHWSPISAPTFCVVAWG